MDGVGIVTLSPFLVTELRSLGAEPLAWCKIASKMKSVGFDLDPSEQN